MSYDEKALSEKLVVATVQSGKVDQNSRGVDLRESCQDRSQVQEQVAREECRKKAVAVALGIRGISAKTVTMPLPRRKGALEMSDVVVPRDYQSERPLVE